MLVMKNRKEKTKKFQNKKRKNYLMLAFFMMIICVSLFLLMLANFSFSIFSPVLTYVLNMLLVVSLFTFASVNVCLFFVKENSIEVDKQEGFQQDANQKDEQTLLAELAAQNLDPDEPAYVDAELDKDIKNSQAAKETVSTDEKPSI